MCSTVTNPKEKIDIGVWDEDLIKDDLEGVCELELPDDRNNDQETQTMWKVLRDEEGNDTEGRLRVGLQYVFDPVRQVDSRLRRFEQEKSKLQEEFTRLSDITQALTSTVLAH
jgi:hypothetical protein